MIKRIPNFLWMLILGLFVVFYSNDSFARENINNTQESMNLFKTVSGKVTRTLSNIGNWGYWFQHDGVSAHDPFTGGSGGYYPRGTAGAIYRDGLIWGGIIQDPDTAKAQLRVGGNAYRCGTQPGWVGSDPDEQGARIYRIRSDWKTLVGAAVIQDAAEQNNVSPGLVTEAMTDEIVEQYKDDWKNWPVDLGAPYVDADSNGYYNPSCDEDGYPDPDEGDYPGIAMADQAIWFVLNDLNIGKVNDLSGSSPIGLEIQTTVWAYAQPGASLGQIVFKKYKIINKSGFQIDSMYVCQWSDPDLGAYGNDQTGCDTTLSMMFAYNGEPTDDQYAAFGLAPPAVGYDFFQGPMIASPGDTAVFDLKYVPDHKNLPMTSYGYFGSGTRWTDPDQGVYDGTLQWYNLLRGYAPTTDIENPTWFLTTCGPDEGLPTKFPLSGDPVNDPTGQLGDVDGNTYQFGDRRMLQSTGPFVMEPDDIQEVVVAVVGGHGNDNLTSVTALKTTDKIAQDLYNDLFTTVPKAPKNPNVAFTPMDGVITLEWGSDLAAVAQTEKDNLLTGYNFEGYNVYQLPTATAPLSQAKRLATFDIVNDVTTIMGNIFVPEYGQILEVPIQYGGDVGIQRYLTIEKDYITNLPLYRGSIYYFAVTAYNYNAEPELIEDKALESAPIILQITPQDPKPGVRYSSDVNEEISVTHNGPSDGNILINIIDPKAVKGHNYKVAFATDTDTNSSTFGEIIWDLIDETEVDTILSKQSQLAPSASGTEAPIIHGFQIKVYGPPMGINPNRIGEAYGKDTPTSMTYLTGWDFEGTRWIGGRDKGWIGLFGGLGNGADHIGTSLTDPTEYMDVDILFAGNYAASATTVEELMDSSKAADPDRWSKIVSYDGWDTWSPRLADAPFAAYDVEGDTLRRLKCLILEDGVGNLIWDMGWDISTETFVADGAYEYIYILNETYDEEYTEYLADATLFDRAMPVLYTISPQARGTHPYLEAPWKMMIFASNVNTSADEFTFSTESNVESDDLAKEDVKKINVFPNPYYGCNPQETTRFDRFVTFNHLPQKATFRIFNLAGVQVRKLEKDNDSQFFRWDLQNERGLPVASGIYIVHIDMPELGKEKVLKLCMVQPNQILEYY